MCTLLARLYSGSIFLLFALFVSRLYFDTAQAASVPFPNGGFETFPNNGTSDWTWPGADWVWDSNVTHSGAHSARIQRSSGSATTSLRSAYISVQPSTVYTMTYWLRTQNATWYPRVDISQYTKAGVQTGITLNTYANIGNGTNNWRPITYRLQTTPNADTIRVRLYLYTDTTGTFWFDDFALDQGAPALYPFQSGFPVVASGWISFSSPTVADIDGDGDNELLVGSSSGAVDGWDHRGNKLSNYPLITGDGTIISQLALADLDDDEDLEIIAGTRTPVTDGNGRVFVWHHTGALLSGWPQSVAWNSQYGANQSLVSSVAVVDIGEIMLLRYWPAPQTTPQIIPCRIRQPSPICMSGTLMARQLRVGRSGTQLPGSMVPLLPVIWMVMGQPMSSLAVTTVT